MSKTIRIGPAPFIAVDHQGEGELLLLLHGVGGNRINWRDNLTALSKRFKTVAWDARGWGDSDDYEGPLTLAEMSRDIVRVIDHFGYDKAHIVGLSMGGRNAMHFATAYPDRLSSLILCDTVKGFSGWGDKKRVDFIQSRKGELEVGRQPADIAEPMARSLVSPTASEDSVEQLTESLRRLRKDMYIKAIEMLVGEADHEDLDEITAPTLVMVGEDDPLTPISDAQEIAASVPNSQLYIVPGAGHLVNIEKSEIFNEIVLNFLDKNVRDDAVNAP